MNFDPEFVENAKQVFKMVVAGVAGSIFVYIILRRIMDHINRA